MKEDEAEVAAEEEAALLALHALAVLLPAVAAPPLLPPTRLFLLLEEVEGRDLPAPTGMGWDRPALAPGKAVDDVVNDFAWPVLPPLALLPGPWSGGGGGGVTDELVAAEPEGPPRDDPPVVEPAVPLVPGLA